MVFVGMGLWWLGKRNLGQAQAFLVDRLSRPALWYVWFHPAQPVCKAHLPQRRNSTPWKARVDLSVCIICF